MVQGKIRPLTPKESFYDPILHSLLALSQIKIFLLGERRWNKTEDSEVTDMDWYLQKKRLVYFSYSHVEGKIYKNTSGKKYQQ